MKVKYIICTLAGILLIAMYVIGYKTASAWETEVVTYAGGTDSKEANNDSGIILKNSARYILEAYNNDTMESTSGEAAIPIDFIGFTREEMVEFIGNNPEYFQEEGETVKNVMLISFSESKVVIRKNIEPVEEATTYDFSINANEPKYYIFLIDNVVVVYKSDKTTLYMETGITAEELETDVAAELSMGVAVKSISDLYRLLESYTS